MVHVCVVVCVAMDAIKEQFSYDDMNWALSKGALCYSCYFIASFPLVYWLDEPVSPPEHPIDLARSHRIGRSILPVDNERWSVAKTVENALAAGIAHGCPFPFQFALNSAFMANCGVVDTAGGCKRALAPRNDWFHSAGFGDTIRDCRLAKGRRARMMLA